LVLAGDTANAIKTLEFFVIPGELTEAGLQLANLYAETENPRTIAFCDSMNKNDESKRDPNPDYLKGFIIIILVIIVRLLNYSIPV
jgi:hypothetical protein